MRRSVWTPEPIFKNFMQVTLISYEKRKNKAIRIFFLFNLIQGSNLKIFGTKERQI